MNKMPIVLMLLLISSSGYVYADNTKYGTEKQGYTTASHPYQSICGNHICSPNEIYLKSIIQSKIYDNKTTQIIIPKTMINTTSQNKTHMVNANVCILEPTDFYMNKNYLLPLITNDVQKHNVTITQINVVDELNGKTQGCNVQIHIERAINSNMLSVDKDTRYLVSGNSITIFTEKKAFGNAYGNQQLTPTNRIMTNWACWLSAMGTFHQNVGLDYHSRQVCDPYAGSTVAIKSNELSPVLIQKSVDSALKQLGL